MVPGLSPTGFQDGIFGLVMFSAILGLEPEESSVSHIYMYGFRAVYVRIVHLQPG